MRPDSRTNPVRGGSALEDHRIELRGEYGVTATITLRHPEGVLVPTLTSVADASIRPDYKTIWHTRPIHITAVGPDFEAFDTALSSDDTVSEPRLIKRYPDRRVYSVTPTREPSLLMAIREDDHYIVDMRSEGSGWLVELETPSKQALSSFRDRLIASDVEFELRELRERDQASREVPETLPAHQRELLTKALEWGYFDVPRGCSQEDLADEFNITPAAVSQQIRLAIKKVLELTEAPGITPEARP